MTTSFRTVAATAVLVAATVAVTHQPDQPAPVQTASASTTDSVGWPNNSPSGPSCLFETAYPLHPKSDPPCSNYFNAANTPIGMLVPPTRWCVRRSGWPMIVGDDPEDTWDANLGYAECKSTKPR